MKNVIAVKALQRIEVRKVRGQEGTGSERYREVRVGRLAGLWVAVAMAVGGMPVASAQQPAPAFDLNHMRGTWYEIARYPDKSQKDCARNDFQLIAFGDGKNTVTFVDSCTGKHGDMDMKSSRATQVKSGEAKIKVRRWLIFSKSYVVLATGKDDAWMVLGNANHKELWVLSKTRELAADALAEAEAKADGAGFASSKLIMVPQDPPPTA